MKLNNKNNFKITISIHGLPYKSKLKIKFQLII